jgi:hypothetical protein
MSNLPARREVRTAYTRPVVTAQRPIPRNLVRRVAVVLAVYVGGRLHQFVKDARRVLRAGR